MTISERMARRSITRDRAKRDDWCGVDPRSGNGQGESWIKGYSDGQKRRRYFGDSGAVATA